MADWVRALQGAPLGWALLAGAAVAGWALHALVYRTADAAGRRWPRLLFLQGSLLRNSRGAMAWVLPLLSARLALPATAGHLSGDTRAFVARALGVALILACTWLGLRLTRILEEVAHSRYDVSAEDNLRARRVRTRVGLLRRVAVVAIGVVGVGLLLLQTPGFRAFGTGLLASAGVLGIVIGIAAQRPIANLLAGIQLAVTQPIRVEDAVIVEDEWGWIEEITLTYVVIRLWDLRRMVLPISYFLEKPFQNWTRTSASLIGTVFVYADYTVPVDAVRAELDRIVRDSPLWDGQACALQVTDLTEKSVQLRVMVSAANAGRVWDLRCEVREKLVAFLQQNHPGALPRLRVETGRPMNPSGADGR
jgi:small-conductance mechanosensitive channel